MITRFAFIPAAGAAVMALIAAAAVYLIPSVRSVMSAAMSMNVSQ